MSVSVSSELRLLPDLIAPQPQARKDRRDRTRADRRFNPLRNDLEPAALVGKDRRNERERRATNRVEVALDCVERVGSQRFFRITHDLSTFGLSTAPGSSHPIGTRMQLALSLPDGNADPVFVEAIVIGYHSETGGMRLAFRDPSADVVKRIHKFVSRA